MPRFIKKREPGNSIDEDFSDIEKALKKQNYEQTAIFIDRVYGKIREIPDEKLTQRDKYIDLAIKQIQRTRSEILKKREETENNEYGQKILDVLGTESLSLMNMRGRNKSRWNESRYRNLAANLTATASILCLLGGILFLSSNITGNAVGLSEGSSNAIGIIFIIIGLIASFLWFNKR